MYAKIPSAEAQNVTDRSWLKRMGLAGFMFFFLKGIMWLLIPWLAHSAMF